MIEANLMEEIDCGSFLEDLIDFPTTSDDIPHSSPVLPSFFSSQHSLPPSDLSAELSLPYEDIVQLEWLSNFVEESFSADNTLTINDKQLHSPSFNIPASPHHYFHTSSPVSVLESSSSCSGDKSASLSPEVVASARRGRPRSKRPRPASFTPRPAMHLISPTSSVNESPQPGVHPRDSENFAESRLLIKVPKQVLSEHKKKKKIKFTAPVEIDPYSPPAQQAVRKCMHCDITKTPQWRAGPMGPKTLCNACGVRYKSGRLFPEYRPAASPTFVPSLHSNSHKKVIEMRTRVVPDGPMDGAMTANSPELIPNNSNITMDYM